MKNTIQYQEHKEMNRLNCFDNLKYNCKKWFLYLLKHILKIKINR